MSLVTNKFGFPKLTQITASKLEAILLLTSYVSLDVISTTAMFITRIALILFFSNQCLKFLD
jgi:hypothetical protein